MAGTTTGQDKTRKDTVNLQMIRILGGCQWNEKKRTSSLFVYPGLSCSKEIVDVGSPSASAITLDSMSWYIENERFDGVIERGVGYTGINCDINTPLHAFQIRWYTDKESMRRNMKLMHKGLLFDWKTCY